MERRRKTKILITGILIISLGLPSAASLYARETLNGISEKREAIASREDGTYKILEIVPDKSVSRAGFYFAGQEPFCIYDEAGEMLFDSWEDDGQNVRPWQSVLELFSSEEERHDYLNLLYDRIKADDRIKGLVEKAEQNSPEQSPITYMEYKEVSEEEYENEPDKYQKYEMAAGEKLGYFERVDSEDYTGKRYDVQFVYDGEMQADSAGSFYQVTEEAQKIDVWDTSWDFWENGDVYVSNSDGSYSYAGKLKDIREASEQDTGAGLGAGETEEEGTEALEPENPELENPESGNPEPPPPESGNPEPPPLESGSTEPNSSEPGNPESKLPESGSTEPRSSEPGNLEPKSPEAGNSEPESTGTGNVQGEAVNTEWKLYSAPVTEYEDIQDTPVALEELEEDNILNEPEAEEETEYWYLKFEKIEYEELEADKQYYRAVHYEESEEGAWLFKFVTDDSPYLDTVLFGDTVIYYEGGFINNEWFKRYAYDMEEDILDSFQVKVTVMTIDKLNNWIAEGHSYEEFDFILIQDGSFMSADGELKGGFIDEADFDKENAERLFSDIISHKIPAVVDSSIVFAKDTSAEEVNVMLNQPMNRDKPYLWKLAALLMQESPDKFMPQSDVSAAFNFNMIDPATWQSIEGLEGFVADKDKSYVNRNIYVSYEKSFINEGFDRVIWNDSSLGQEKVNANMEGFEDVLLEIENENMYREAEASWAGEPLSTDICESAVLRYIINYEYQRAVYLKSSLNILDIEPTIPDKNSYPLTADDVMKWIAKDSPITKDNIKITTMTVSEFIGKTEDINANYDMIYIGTDTDKLNMQNERTIFNDSSMTGLVYFHAGDYRYSDARLGGLLQRDYYSSTKLYEWVKVRYSGLDLTKEKLQALKSYADASYPIVLSENFYTQDSVGETIINESYIDNSSYMYEFSNEMLEKNKKNVFSKKILDGASEGGKAGIKLFSFYINRPKLKLIDTRVKCDYISSNDVYQIAASGGEYMLEYGFTIQNIGAVSNNTKYRCKLYIDINADGKFSPLERIDDISITQGSSSVSPDGLTAGVSYTLRRRVPDGYKGVLNWKIELVQADNDNIRTSMSGYSQMIGLEPETIRILQICRGPLFWDGAAAMPWLSGGGWWGDSTNRRLNLEDELKNNSSNYYKLVHGGMINGVSYEGIEEDFNIEVNCVTIEEFHDMYESASDKKSVLRDYNMLILGFSDSYQDIKAECINGVGGIAEFIESGKSVLFAHDTTSFFNYDYKAYGYPDNKFDMNSYGVVNDSGNRVSKYSYQRYTNDLPWAYNLNTFVRPLVGMDRYGVNELNIVKAEDGTVTSVGNTERSNLLKKGAGLRVSDNPILNTQGYDIAYKAKSNKTETVAEVQGYTYSVIALKDQNTTANRKGERNQYLNFNFSKISNNLINNGQINDGAGDSETNAVQVNSGLITTYPYKLKEKFPISSTHAQYYQLNLDSDSDADGEGDLVVWYCLGENKGGGDNIYSISPNDVVNNYYIYNKGNVTYTGMGHSGRQSAEPAYVEEAKLFINTIIAAYTASVRSPEVTIINEKTQKKLNDIYNYHDAMNNIHFNDNMQDYQKVYFTVNDNNFVKGDRKIAVSFYREAPEGDKEISYKGYNYKIFAMEGLPVFWGDADDNDANDVPADSNALASGGLYYVRIPRTLLEYREGAGVRQSLFVEACGKIKRYNQEITTPAVYDKVDMVSLQLFELD